jgi:hypothetical protein
MGQGLDHELRWNKPVQRLSSETNRNIGFTFRNLKGAGQGTKGIAYKTIIRPPLEYCSSACDPYIPYTGID